MAIENEGAPTNWTVRFKHGYITIFLLCEPLEPFSSLITELLEILHERYPAGLPVPSQPDQYIPIPDSASDIALARPVDLQDMDKGWEEIKFTTSNGAARDTPKGLGLKDGACLAFMIRLKDDEEMEADLGGTQFVVEWPVYEEPIGGFARDGDMEEEEEEEEE